MIKETKAVCEFCQNRCRVIVHSENGKVVEIDEDRSYPMVDAMFPPIKACIRLRGAKEWFHHPDRLNFPLKRVGERGEGKWRQIPWELALDEVADRLKEAMGKYGKETVAFVGGTGRTREHFTGRFFNLLGTPNVAGQGNICWTPLVQTNMAMFGWPFVHRVYLVIEKGSKTKCILVVGMNPAHSRTRLWKSMRDAKEMGVKIIVVDPRRTEAADLADIWLQIRPGSDTALLMAMLNVIINENLYDKDFVAKWCYGFDELAKRVEEFTPEKVAGITWLPPDKIRETARILAQNTPASVVNGMGLEHQSNSIAGIQAMLSLMAITGSTDVEGGMYMPGPSRRAIIEPEMELRDLISPEQKAKQLGRDRFSLIGWKGHDLIMPPIKKVWGKYAGMSRSNAAGHDPSIYRAMITGRPYPVKALIGLASNPMITQANTKLVYKALKSLDLFVVSDYWRTPSAELADYVFPAASWLERPYLRAGWGIDNVIVGGEKALPSEVPGEYERRTDYEFWRGLGIRLGQEQYWPWSTLEETYDYQLQPLETTFKQFMAEGGFEFPARSYRKYEKLGFATATGKVELYSTVLDKLGHDPLPYYEESHENPLTKPQLAKEFPLMLITGGRFQFMYHSEHFNIDSVRRRHPHPLLQINPETAGKLDIKNGDWVWIESPRGRVRMKASLFDGIDPRVVHGEHGWWFPELPGEEPWLHGVWESNINVLTDDDPDVCDKASGGWPLKTALCRVYKVKGY